MFAAHKAMSNLNQKPLPLGMELFTKQLCFIS